MKKYIYILIALSVLALSACKKEEKMPDYIPANLSEEDTGKDANKGDDTGQTADENSQDSTSVQDGEAKDDEESGDQPIVVGKTTKMYVKLKQYGGYLNIRPTPSTDGEPVGFLVHAEEVDVIEIKDGWASFMYKGKICYVNADYLVDKQPAYLEAPTPTPKPTATPAPAEEPAGEDEEPREI